MYKRRFSVLVERQSFPDHPNPNPKAQPNMAENTGRGLSALAPRQQKNKHKMSNNRKITFDSFLKPGGSLKYLELVVL
jgi:hypothetical protein